MISSRAAVLHFPTWLGDLVMAIPFARAFCRSRGAERLIAVVEPALAPVLARAALPMEIWPLGKKDRGELFSRLSEEKPGEVVFLTNSFGSMWPYLRARVPARGGLGGKWTRFLLTRRVETALELPALEMPQGRRNMLLLDAGTQPRANDFSPLLEIRRVDASLPSLFVFPGAKYGPAKRWGEDSFVRALRAMQTHGWKILLCGTAEEASEAEAILARLDVRRALNLCGVLNLEALIRRVEETPNPLCLANDSGAMHLMAACGVPTLGLFLSTSALRTPPAFGCFRVMEAGISCRPCFRRECPFGHHRCREALSPKAVELELLAMRGT